MTAPSSDDRIAHLEQHRDDLHRHISALTDQLRAAKRRADLSARISPDLHAALLGMRSSALFYSRQTGATPIAITIPLAHIRALGDLFEALQEISHEQGTRKAE